MFANSLGIYLLTGLLISTSAFASNEQKDSVTPAASKAEAVMSAPTPVTVTAAPVTVTVAPVTVTAAPGTVSAAPGTVSAAPVISNTCATCHSADGNSASPAFPKISALSEKYTVKQLQEFKKGDKGKRNNAVMQAIANELSEQDMHELASYYAKQKRSVSEASATNIELGQRIYRAGNPKTGVPACSGCHMADGAGNNFAGFPNISGQNAEYIAAQLHAFKAGERSNDLNSMMQTITAKMSEQEIEAVSNYVSGLH
jgi:cytochrome c553